MNKRSTKELFEYDLQFDCVVAGVDEAGCGPLAGPVVCACVIMPLKNDKFIDGINDSKKLSEKKRDFLYNLIISNAIDYNIDILDNEIIDDINIFNASILGMKNSIIGLKTLPNIVLTDARKIETAFPTKAITKGDAISYNIAAASIIAKTTRDNIMRDYAKQYPQYGFDKHKGYPTKEHFEAIKKYGRCVIHRKTYAKNKV